MSCGLMLQRANDEQRVHDRSFIFKSLRIARSICHAGHRRQHGKSE